MKSQNKYYVPDITEFHIGFEYEVFDEENEVWSNKIFPEDFICTGTSVEPDLVELFYSGLKDTRIKYLDREDIESLGFKYYKTHPGTTTLEFEGDKCDITFDSEFSKYWNITITDNEDTNFTYFHGFIKNKSELKRLLKQLNI